MDARISRVIQTIDTVVNYGDDAARAALSVQQLADEAGLSRFHLQRLFKRDTGSTIRHYLQDALLGNAAVRVRFSRESLLSIALTLGFGSQQAFTRAFTRRWGVPPGELRNRALEVTASYPQLLAGDTIPVRIVQARARTLWAVRYVGAYPQVPRHWQDFHARLLLAGLPRQGPFLGMVYDDPQLTPPEQIRYACAIEAPAEGVPPHGWYSIELCASRFAVFAIHCRYLEGLVRLRARVHDWLARSGETFGPAAGFEHYLHLPEVGEDREQYMELHLSLAG